MTVCCMPYSICYAFDLICYELARHCAKVVTFNRLESSGDAPPAVPCLQITKGREARLPHTEPFRTTCQSEFCRERPFMPEILLHLLACRTQVGDMLEPRGKVDCCRQRWYFTHAQRSSTQPKTYWILLSQNDSDYMSTEDSIASCSSKGSVVMPGTRSQCIHKPWA